MSEDKMKDVTASILQRLKNYSQARKEDRGLTITNYAIERFLYRMGVSKYADQFVLKGAQLFRIWTNDVYRPTRDLDLLRFGDAVNPPAQEIIFPSILKMPNPKFKAYLYDTVIAEKVEAMVALGYVNSRMKDFYDVFQLSDKFEFDGQLLSNTIQQTF